MYCQLQCHEAEPFPNEVAAAGFGGLGGADHSLGISRAGNMGHYYVGIILNAGIIFPSSY